jgi:hypothetical protein
VIGQWRSVRLAGYEPARLGVAPNEATHTVANYLLVSSRGREVISGLRRYVILRVLAPVIVRVIVGISFDVHAIEDRAHNTRVCASELIECPCGNVAARHFGANHE